MAEPPHNAFRQAQSAITVELVPQFPARFERKPFRLSCPVTGEPGPFHVPIVPMSVKAPVAASMLYIETLFEAEFVT